MTSTETGCLYVSGFWQSVTGSRENQECLRETARREVHEETGLVIAPDQLQDWQQSSQYEIYPYWRHRYAPGTLYNTEHVFSAQVPATSPIRLSAHEHVQWRWYDLPTAITKVFSPSNRDMLTQLPQHWSLNI